MTSTTGQLGRFFRQCMTSRLRLEAAHGKDSDISGPYKHQSEKCKKARFTSNIIMDKKSSMGYLMLHASV